MAAIAICVSMVPTPFDFQSGRLDGDECDELKFSTYAQVGAACDKGEPTKDVVNNCTLQLAHLNFERRHSLPFLMIEV